MTNSINLLPTPRDMGNLLRKLLSLGFVLVLLASATASVAQSVFSIQPICKSYADSVENADQRLSNIRELLSSVPIARPGTIESLSLPLEYVRLIAEPSYAKDALFHLSWAFWMLENGEPAIALGMIASTDVALVTSELCEEGILLTLKHALLYELSSKLGPAGSGKYLAYSPDPVLKIGVVTESYQSALCWMLHMGGDLQVDAEFRQFDACIRDK